MGTAWPVPPRQARHPQSQRALSTVGSHPHGLGARSCRSGSGPTADPLRCAAHKRIRPRKEQGAMRAGRWQIGVTLWLMLSGAIPSATAQELVRAPEQIRGCLCQERSVGALNAEVQTQSRGYEEKRQAFQALDQQVRTTRPLVNVANPADVDAFKRLLERRDHAADALASDATKSYSEAVARSKDQSSVQRSAPPTPAGRSRLPARRGDCQAAPGAL